VLGILAIVIPPLATIAFTLFLGWLFLISGIVGLVTTFWARPPGFWWSLFSAVLAVAAGLVLLAWPVSGAVSLTFADRVLHHRGRSLDHVRARAQEGAVGRWGWMLVSGIIDLVWPPSS
jgi:uncharacterized membrane protein HdeD (DUF308 family)